jgi:hypothetical protein
MRVRLALALVVTIAGVVAAGSRRADGLPRWKKVILDRTFRSEGVAVADVNRDGRPDVLVGDFWYEAPNWTMHVIRRDREFDAAARSKGYYGDGLKSYSECMCCWADDVNGDGWVDQIVIGFPGKPAYWYENPKGAPGPWKEHVVWHSACNESPQYVDLFGDQKRVLVMGWQPIRRLTTDPASRLEARRHTVETEENLGQMAWFRPGTDPTRLWVTHAVSEPSRPGQEVPGTQRFSHGLGVGDVNGDGRLDVICTGGWWEQPGDGAKAAGPWPFHPSPMGVSCADMFAIDLDGRKRPAIVCSSAHQYGIWAFRTNDSAVGPKVARQDLFDKLVSETHALHYVDVDGDGRRDLVTGKRHWSHGRAEPGSGDPAMVYWLKAHQSDDGVVTFLPHVIDDDSGIGTQFEVVDVDGDGRLDVVTSNKKGVFILLQRPAE